MGIENEGGKARAHHEYRSGRGGLFDATEGSERDRPIDSLSLYVGGGSEGVVLSQ